MFFRADGPHKNPSRWPRDLLSRDGGAGDYLYCDVPQATPYGRGPRGDVAFQAAILLATIIAAIPLNFIYVITGIEFPNAVEKMARTWWYGFSKSRAIS